jgi:hypothetical protein
MEHHPRGFVAPQRQLTLEEERGDATLIGGHQVRSPEPYRKRRFRVMQNRPGRHRGLVPTTTTLPASQFHQFIRPAVPAARTHEAIRPAAGSQILLASLLSSKLRLKLAQCLRKTAGGALPHTIACGLLKQPYKQKPAKRPAHRRTPPCRERAGRACPNQPFRQTVDSETAWSPAAIRGEWASMSFDTFSEKPRFSSRGNLSSGARSRLTEACELL